MSDDQDITKYEFEHLQKKYNLEFLPQRRIDPGFSRAPAFKASPS